MNTCKLHDTPFRISREMIVLVKSIQLRPFTCLSFVFSEHTHVNGWSVSPRLCAQCVSAHGHQR